jgi:outer membrane autotransporter protein
MALAASVVTLPALALAEDIIGYESPEGSAISGQSHTFTDQTPYGDDELIGFITQGALSNNTVTVDNSSASGVLATESDGGDVSGNTLIINSGAYGWAETAYTTGSGNATGNTITINGGTFSEGVSGVTLHDGKASGNTVNIRGGTISGYVAGGVIEATGDDGASGPSYKGSATGNTINIDSSAADLSNADLYGGKFLSATVGTGDIKTGNTLNLNGVKGVAVQSVQNFESLNFYLPENTANGDTILKVAGTADIRGSTIGVAVQGAAPTLKAGDKVTLIDAGTLQADGTIKTRALQGSTIEYDFTTVQEGNKLVSTVAGGNATEKAKSTAEGFVAGAAALTAAADFAASQGVSSAVSAANSGAGMGGGQGFGTTGGGSIRNNTGSHVDVRSFNIVAGLAKGLKLDSGDLTLGGFFEYGFGNYSSFNDFTTGDVRGDGDTRSYGVGLLAHHEFLSKLYVEGSIRGGRAKQDYRSVDLVPGVVSSYESSANYFGVHLGVGKLWSLSDRLGLDTYAQYIWQRQGGDTVQMSTGETLEFGVVNSHRSRVGLRINKDFTEQVRAYAGVAHEYEFDGKAHAKTNGMPITSPSMKGGSAMLELGVIARPIASAKTFTVGLGLNGYAGQKEGVTGSLNIGYKF